jgi:hypothetical protein
MIIHAIKKARDFLDQTQNNDGGWGYQAGRLSVTEPTALVMLAKPSPSAWQRAEAWLLRIQQDDGGWGMSLDDDASNWLTAWAVWALLNASTEESLSAARQGIDWLLDVPVARTDDPITSGLIGVNPALAGWAWQPDGGAWTEPTALSVIVLLAAGVSDHPRVREGLAFLRDRVCPDGGWNVGAPFNFGKQMPSTLYHTVLTLLALRFGGGKIEDPMVTGGLEVTRELLTAEVAASSLAWGIIALRAWQADDASLREQLLKRQSEDGGWENSPYSTASALLALQKPEPPFLFGG